MSEQYRELPREEHKKDPVLMRLLRMGFYDWTDKDARLNQVGFLLPGLFVGTKITKSSSPSNQCGIP